ncbi:MAG: hypothetical protein Q7W02_02255 [Candidatus Rokubacteria bacterium]|nr:hypothetical protein [Candidatus Rokubacteria bacterium]
MFLKMGAGVVLAFLVVGCATVYTNGKTRVDYDRDEKACLAAVVTRLKEVKASKPEVFEHLEANPELAKAILAHAYSQCMVAGGWNTDENGITLPLPSVGAP